MKGKLMIIMLALNIQAQAQDVSLGSYKIADETQLWRLTNNAAGLSLDRGVGLDVVKTKIEGLGGSIECKTEE